METITIQGKPFQAPVRYEEGHELTANEASALNQTYHENLRNNFAKRVKEAIDAGTFDADIFQIQFEEYAQAYAFGVRTGGGGGERDPVMSEALRIAKLKIREALKKAGKKNVDPKAINEAARKHCADPVKGASTMELARKRVAEQQAAAGEDLAELVADLPQKEAA